MHTTVNVELGLTLSKSAHRGLSGEGDPICTLQHLAKANQEFILEVSQDDGEAAQIPSRDTASRYPLMLKGPLRLSALCEPTTSPVSL